MVAARAVSMVVATTGKFDLEKMANWQLGSGDHGGGSLFD